MTATTVAGIGDGSREISLGSPARFREEGFVRATWMSFRDRAGQIPLFSRQMTGVCVF